MGGFDESLKLLLSPIFQKIQLVVFGIRSNSGYITTQSYKILPQEVAKLKGEKREKGFPVHRFILPTENMQVRVGDEKVSMRFNPPNGDGLYNTDFLLLLYQGNGLWQHVLKPGNFRFDKTLTTDELQERIKQLIVRLTFK